MPLVVPVLRFIVVFLNIYETFKTLKPPPPSARRGGKPSVRAISQRKRDLKGCLAVWAVWCCYAAYERTFDRVVAIFLPFYSEIKSVFLLFLLLTRAKGAEPLFLHVLRPLVKPYAIVVDPILDLSSDLGDFFFALLQVPVDYFLSLSWFRFRTVFESNAEPGKTPCDIRAGPPELASSTQPSHLSGIPVLDDQSSAVQAFGVQNEGNGSTQDVSDTRHLHLIDGLPLANTKALHFSDRRSKSASTTSPPAYSEHPSQAPPLYSWSLSKRNGHQIRYPPSAYAALDQEASTRDFLGTAPEYHSPEWRTYPAFPSAYPPTPLPASTSLPSSVTAKSDNHSCVFDSTHPPIPEDEQDFSEPLSSQRGEHAGPVHFSSNHTRIPSGVNGNEDNTDATRQPDEDTLIDDSMCSSETGLSEDDFGSSLRTPHRSPGAIPSSAYSSVESLTSPLQVADKAPPLRTWASSDSFSSDSSSLAGRKRTRGTLQGTTRSTLPVPQSRNATLRGRPGRLIPQDPLQSSTSEGEDDPRELRGDYGGIKVKRQKVLDPLKRNSTVRPAARGTSSTHKASLPSRSATGRGRVVVTAPQPTIRVRGGSVTTNNSTMKGRKSTLGPHQVLHVGPQGVVKSSSTSSQSGTMRGKTS